MAPAEDPCTRDLCAAKPSAWTFPLLLAGLTVAVVGGLGAYFYAPDDQDLKGLVIDWNQRYPERQLLFIPAEQQLFAAEGGRLLRPWTIKGRGTLTFGPYETPRLDRGERTVTVRGEGDGPFVRTTAHSASFDLRHRQTGSVVRGLCSEQEIERLSHHPGRPIRTPVSRWQYMVSRHLYPDIEFNAETLDFRFYCTLQSPAFGAWQLRAARDPQMKFAFTSNGTTPDANEQGSKPLVFEGKTSAAARAYWTHRSSGYVASEQGRPIAIIETAPDRRLAIDAEVPAWRRDLIATAAIAILLFEQRLSLPHRGDFARQEPEIIFGEE